MTSLIDPSFITSAPVSKTGMRQQLQTAKDEISAIQDTDLPNKLSIAGGTMTGNLIFSNAKIGINNATPSWPLVIASQAAAGAIRVLGRTADNIGSIEFMDNTQTTTQSYLQSTPTSMIFGIGATEVMRLTSSGIKTASPLVDIASAATVDLNAQNSNNVRVTGTTAITSLGTAPAGARYYLTFANALIITYNATSLQTPGLANITTAANDNAVVRSLGSGNWVIESYTCAAGLPALQGAVTGSGLTMATARLLGRTNAGTGAPQEISIGGGLTLTGGVLTGARQPAAAGDGVWAAQEFNSAAWVLPAGGTYAYIVLGFETSPRIWSGGTARFAGVAAGGTTVVAASTGVTWWGMYWRIA